MSIINSPLLLTGADTGYRVSRSLRFNSADSAYLSRTPASVGTSLTTMTISMWAKISGLNTDNFLFVAGNDTSDYFIVSTNTSNQIRILTGENGSTNLNLTNTVAVFRDPSAWYHLLIQLDWGNATSTDRIKLYVNGGRVTLSGSFASQGYTGTRLNRAFPHYIGRHPAGSGYLNGYLADIHFIDGQALEPTSFATTDSTTGQWIPKLYSGSYGTNGFKLTFADNSNTTAATLGADSSGNGNNWTPNNLSVTAGAGNDALTDTPTSYGSGTSGGDVRGNFCTWNPLGTAGPASSNGNLDIASSSTAGNKIGTFLLTSGKWYWECSGDGYAGAVVGVGGEGFTGSMSSSGSKAIGYWFGGGIYWDGGSFTSGIASYTTTDVIGVAVDMTAGTVAFYKNNTLVYTATFGSGTVPNLSSGVYPGFNTGNPGGSARTVIANFGQRAFAYTPPANFKPLVDTYLPTPTVAKPNTVFDVKLYTGNAGNQTISGFSFSPDFIWTKSRSQAYSHNVYDSVRGISKNLFANETSAENTDANTIKAFNSDGFQLGSNDNGNYTNNGSAVAWAWDAGSSTVTNNVGSITSQVRANASAGFSIVSVPGYTYPTKTAGHGLGVEPHFIITKNRGVSNPWMIYHKSAGANTYFQFDTGAGYTGVPGVWSGVSSTVFPINSGVNQQTDIIAYCFAPVTGYSSFGSYTGNGSSDGPFVYTGFKVKWLMIKRTDSTSNWYMIDASRSPYNEVNDLLYAEQSLAETVDDGNNGIDFLSNGFKLRKGVGGTNVNGSTLIYAAFAENPFAYARAR